MVLLGLCWAGASCSRAGSEPTEAPAVAPAPASEPESDAGPDLEQNTFVSTSFNEDDAKDEPTQDVPKAKGNDLSELATVTTAEDARQRAEAAIADQLDPNRSYKMSPILPAQWPIKDRAAVVFFYPMAPNPPSLTEFRVFSAAFRVTVMLEDGATEVKTISKRRKLGTIKETRVTSLERRELEMAEAAMIRQLLGFEIKAGAKPYWGYLKYVHEHPKVGRDLERRSSAFYGWLRRKHGK
ncbi:MAG: hypothetical protein AAF799_21605 [Myxococcota bacterium]